MGSEFIVIVIVIVIVVVSGGVYVEDVVFVEGVWVEGGWDMMFGLCDVMCYMVVEGVVIFFVVVYVMFVGVEVCLFGLFVFWDLWFVWGVVI